MASVMGIFSAAAMRVLAARLLVAALDGGIVGIQEQDVVVDLLGIQVGQGGSCSCSMLRTPRTSMTTATRLSWFSPCRAKSTIRGSSATGMLSMQKKPMSSSALTAIDLPAPDRPVTIQKVHLPPPLSYFTTRISRSSTKPVSGLNDLPDLLGQFDHVGAGRAAAVDDKAAVLSH